LGQASENGVPVVGGRGLDSPENLACEGEVAGGGDGAELEELCAGRVELEFAGCYEMGLELLHANQRGAFLQQ